MSYSIYDIRERERERGGWSNMFAPPSLSILWRIFSKTAMGEIHLRMSALKHIFSQIILQWIALLSSRMWQQLQGDELDVPQPGHRT